MEQIDRVLNLKIAYRVLSLWYTRVHVWTFASVLVRISILRCFACRRDKFARAFATTIT